MTIVQGKVWKFGDNINTDNMSPAQYMFSVSQVAKHCLEAVRSEFSKDVNSGDIVLGGDNFGTGSSRETAAAALKKLGIALVIAKSFARIFFRNSIDIGLPVMICGELYGLVDDGDLISANLSTGKVVNETKNRVFTAEPLSEAIMDILGAGGLIQYALKKNWKELKI
jgi:3-isopropylmalate/(R)-2-methylmalate dehydratase small subunit